MAFCLRLFPNGKWIQGLFIFSSAGLVVLGFAGPKDTLNSGGEVAIPKPPRQSVVGTGDHWNTTTASRKPSYSQSHPSRNLGHIEKSTSLEPPTRSTEAETLETFVHYYLKEFREKNMQKVLECYSDSFIFRGVPDPERPSKDYLEWYWGSEAGRLKIDDYDLDASPFGKQRWKIVVFENLPNGHSRDRFLIVTTENGFFRIAADSGLLLPGRVAELPKEAVTTLATPEEEVKKLVMSMRRAEAYRDLSGAMVGYGRDVLYFDKKWTREEVREDKAAYFQRWPTLSESVTGKVDVEILTNRYANVTFPSRFRVSNQNSGRWITGNIQNHYTLLLGPGGWKIVVQKGEVANIVKSDD
jgi:hypothetical protein